MSAFIAPLMQKAEDLNQGLLYDIPIQFNKCLWCRATLTVFVLVNI